MKSEMKRCVTYIILYINILDVCNFLYITFSYDSSNKELSHKLGRAGVCNIILSDITMKLKRLSNQQPTTRRNIM